MLLTFEALVFLADEVLHGDFDVFECHIGCATAPDTLAIHPPGTDSTVFAFNEEHGNTIHAFLAGANGGSEVVTPDTIGNPLLLSIDDVVFAIFCELRFAGQVCNVTASIWLRNGKTDSLIAA